MKVKAFSLKVKAFSLSPGDNGAATLYVEPDEVTEMRLEGSSLYLRIEEDGNSAECWIPEESARKLQEALNGYLGLSARLAEELPAGVRRVV